MTIKKKMKNKKLSDEMMELMQEFKKSDKNRSTDADINNFIKVFFSYRMPLNKNDFNDATFYDDFKYCYPLLTAHSKNITRLFYTFLLENGYGHFNKITPLILSMSGGNKWLYNDFVAVPYHILEEIPEENKWLLETNDKIYRFDFTIVDDDVKIAYLKKFIWNYSSCSMDMKFRGFHNCVNALNGLELDSSNSLIIKARDVLKIKNSIKSGVKKSSASALLSPVKSMISFLDDCGNVDMNKTLYNMFKMVNVRSSGQCEAYTSEEMNTILDALLKKSEEDDNDIRELYKIMYYICLIMLNTSMRLTTVLNIKLDSIIESKPGSFYILAPSKKVEVDKYNITKKTKSYFDAVIEITKEYRIKSSTNDYVFIHMKKRGNTIQKLDSQRLTIILKQICIEQNIKELGFTGIRNKYMQDITKYTADTGANDNLLEVLSKHSKQVHYTHYYDDNNEDVDVNLYGVYVGDLILTGKVLKNTSLKKESIVQNGCGHCSLENCNNKSNLDCLMCKNFVTTPSNIPYFENEIVNVDKKIEEQTINHEKEFLITKKRLLVKFLMECKKVSQEVN